jgi:hypothetical protein
MCHKPTQSEARRTRAERSETSSRGPDPGRPWMNTRPRGNGEIHTVDLERGAEKLAALLGR